MFCVCVSSQMRLPPPICIHFAVGYTHSVEHTNAFVTCVLHTLHLNGTVHRSRDCNRHNVQLNAHDPHPPGGTTAHVEEVQEEEKRSQWTELEIRGPIKNLSPEIWKLTHLTALFLNDNNLQVYTGLLWDMYISAVKCI